MNLKFLGTGTSQGVPVIGCHCEVCTSKDPKDKRFRSSALITTELGNKILIDCGPDFRMQMIDNQEENIDAVLITHEHNDHVIGLDDMRPIIFRKQKAIPIYCNKRVSHEIKSRFPYAFADEKYPGAPSFEMNIIENDFTIFNTEITPIEVWHHKIPIFGFKFKELAYITDASLIPDSVRDQLRNLDYLILNCIRKQDQHPAHFVLTDIIEIYHDLKPKKLLLTHLSHHFGKYEIEEPLLPENIHLAYDGMTIEF